MNLNQVLDNLYALIALGGVLATIFGYVNPLLKQKIAKEKNAKVKSRYELLDKWAENAVAEMSLLSNTVGQDKKNEAIRMVNKQLKDHGINMDVEHVSSAIEKAVQKLAENGSSNDNLVDESQQVLEHLENPEVPDEPDEEQTAETTTEVEPAKEA